MSTPSRRRPSVATERGLDRLVNFSDAVVAIAITLVVLPLVDTARDLGEESAARFLTDNGYALGAAALSFVVIGAFWRDHHRLFDTITGYTPLVVRLNLTWLASIVFLPLPTVLLVAGAGGDRVAYALYIGTMLVTQVSGRLIETILARAEMHVPGTAPTRAQLAASWTAVALMAIALVITLLWPSLSVAPLLLTLLTGPVNEALYGPRRDGVRPGRGARAAAPAPTAGDDRPDADPRW